MRLSLSSAFAVALVVQIPGAIEAQSVTERSPNLGGTWLAEPGTIHFNFVHRFNTSPAPERKVLNPPTFLVTTRTPLNTSGGIQLGIPGTPHSMSIHASNTNTTTLEGLSRGTATVRYGFEYTVPIHLSRFRTAKRPATLVTTAERMAELSSDSIATPPADTVKVSIKNLAFSQKRIEVTQGSVVVWTNEDPLTHTVTSAIDAFDSGEILSGTSWAHRFDETGTFEVYCDPHPFMRTAVIVRRR